MKNKWKKKNNRSKRKYKQKKNQINGMNKGRKRQNREGRIMRRPRKCIMKMYRNREVVQILGRE